MFPMRSIELSIILLQPVDGSSRGDEEGREEGRKKRQSEGGRTREGAFHFSRHSLAVQYVMANSVLQCKFTVLFV